MLVKPLVRSIVRAIAGKPTASLGSGFAPSTLFSAGEQGYVYDLNDLSTLYLDAGGYTPATVNGLVGLVLDKKTGLALGAESAVNGSFDTDTNWTKGTGITISGGTLNFTSGTTLNANANQVIGATNGNYVEITIVVSAISVGTLNVQLDSGVGASISITTAGTYTYRLMQPPGFNTVYILAKSAGTTATVDSVSVKVIAGNHAYQSTTGNKPVLRGSPIGANLVTNGDFASGTGWIPNTWVISGGAATATNVSDSLAQNYTFTAGNVYRVTYTVTAFSGTGGVRPRFFGGTTVTGATATAVGTYVEYMTAVTGNTQFALASTTTTATITVDNVQIHDVSAGSVQAPYALQFDGVDDFLQTASVNFTATDKMTVCHGVRKLSDAAAGILAELSVNTNTNNGSFYIAAPSSPGDFEFLSKGTLTVLVARTGNNAPITAVLTMKTNIAGPTFDTTVNTAASATSTSTQGTGNFGNYALYFGRRAGASLPYNGLMFSAICVGKATSATELANIERWTNQRTNAY